MAETGEGLWMSAKERDRLKVLHEVKQRHITQKQAATELGLSVRWVRKLLWRWRAGGDRALRHGLRGRASNRKTPEAVKRRAVELYRKKKQAKLWHDYGPTLAAEAGRAARDQGEPGDAAPVADGGQAVAAATGTSRTSPPMAGAAGTLRRAGAMGHQRA